MYGYRDKDTTSNIFFIGPIDRVRRSSTPPNMHSREDMGISSPEVPFFDYHVDAKAMIKKKQTSYNMYLLCSYTRSGYLGSAEHCACNGLYQGFPAVDKLYCSLGRDT